MEDNHEIFKRWEKEKDKSILKESINRYIKNAYINSEILNIHKIFESKWREHIDLSYDNGSILEFAGLSKEYKNKGQSVMEIKFLIDWIKNSKEDSKKFHNAIHNILLTAINYNRKDIILFITKEQDLIKIDFSYEKCGIISNCFPKNNNQIKKEIFNYFIMECEMIKTPEIESILKKLKKDDILEIFEKIELYKKISNNLENKTNKEKKLKI